MSKSSQNKKLNLRLWIQRGTMISILVTIIFGCVILHVEKKYCVFVEEEFSTIASEIAGTPVHLRKIEIDPFYYRIILYGFRVENPPGFLTQDLLKVDRISVTFKWDAYFCDVITIKNLSIEGITVTWEGSHQGSNISYIQRKIQQYTDYKVKEDDSLSTKKIVIELLTLSESLVQVSTGFAHGRVISLPLRNLQRKNVGKNQGGLDLRALTRNISAIYFTEIGRTTAIVGIGVALGGPAGAAVAIPITQGVKETSIGLLKNIRKVFKKLRPRTDPKK